MNKFDITTTVLPNFEHTPVKIYLDTRYPVAQGITYLRTDDPADLVERVADAASLGEISNFNYNYIHSARIAGAFETVYDNGEPVLALIVETDV